jgi:chaperonin GroES
MVKLKPLADRVVVEVLDAEERTAGGILLPDTAKEKPQQGRVVATGPGEIRKDGSRGDMPLRKGDVVYFGKYSGTDVTVSGEDYKILKLNEVLARIESS